MLQASGNTPHIKSKEVNGDDMAIREVKRGNVFPLTHVAYKNNVNDLIKTLRLKTRPNLTANQHQRQSITQKGRVSERNRVQSDVMEEKGIQTVTNEENS